MKLNASMPNPIKSPCDKCYQGCASYYDYPCYGCIHNPHTPDEISDSHKEDIFKERFDRFIDYKTHVRHSGRNATSILIKNDDAIETWKCGVCDKSFITVAGHQTYYCPACGAKIEYESIE